MRADAWSSRSWTNGGIRPEERAEAMATLQAAVTGANPHGIGVLICEEAPHGHQALVGTTMPVNLAAGAAWDPAAFEEASRTVAAELAASGVHLALVSALDVLRDGRWGRSEEDRKSTRLNSSHVAISYAVFCLKKKKINTTRLVSERLRWN